MSNSSTALQRVALSELKRFRMSGRSNGSSGLSESRWMCETCVQRVLCETRVRRVCVKRVYNEWCVKRVHNDCCVKTRVCETRVQRVMCETVVWNACTTSDVWDCCVKRVYKECVWNAWAKSVSEYQIPRRRARDETELCADQRGGNQRTTWLGEKLKISSVCFWFFPLRACVSNALMCFKTRTSFTSVISVNNNSLALWIVTSDHVWRI